MASDKPSCPSTLPPVTTHNYHPRGKWQQLAGVDVYVVGPSPEDTPPTRAVMAVYDVFGVMPQTMQGCDRVAREVGGWVFMPDFFEGEMTFFCLFGCSFVCLYGSAGPFMGPRVLFVLGISLRTRI